MISFDSCIETGLLRKIPPSLTQANEGIKKKIIVAVEKCVTNQKKVGVLFSGGVDSSVIAKIADKFCDVTCYCAGLADSHDLAAAQQAADAMRLNLKKRVLNEAEVAEYAQKVSAVVRTADRIQVGVGIPLYACCETSREKVVLTGAGADEIFGGYARFARLQGKALSQELAAAYEKMLAVDLRRDVAIGNATGKTVKAPFVQTGLKPLGEVGKPTLRKIALELGVPRFVAQQPKKAAQYGSGTDKILKRL